MKPRSTATLATLLTGIGGAVGGTAHALAAGSASPVSLSAATSPTTTAPAVQPAAAIPSSALAPGCDDGSWIGPDGVNVNGRPDRLDRGDDGAAYIWHGADGWHLRTTDVQNVAHHYTGTIIVSPGASVSSLRPVKLEKDDHVWLTSDNVIHYDLTTYAGVDGFDFRVSACDANRQHETLRFTLDNNGREQDTARIKLGDTKANPPAATFDVRRAV
jgi:hypothetical protein